MSHPVPSSAIRKIQQALVLLDSAARDLHLHTTMRNMVTGAARELAQLMARFTAPRQPH